MQALTLSVSLANGDTVNIKTDEAEGGFMILEIVHGEATISSQINAHKAQELEQKMFAVQAVARIG